MVNCHPLLPWFPEQDRSIQRRAVPTHYSRECSVATTTTVVTSGCWRWDRFQNGIDLSEVVGCATQNPGKLESMSRTRLSS
jgi:hypothetical protein